jgi:tetratricopeptide (TPR) repeat protein
LLIPRLLVHARSTSLLIRSKRSIRGLKIYSKTAKWHFLSFLGGLGLAIVGCTATISTPPPAPAHAPSAQVEEPARPSDQPTPRALASLGLTEQGRLLLERGQLDDAINMLERAVSLNPTNGHNYFYLSEAWLLKGDTVQAEEFNRLAAIYLREDVDWMARVMEQGENIKWRMR